MNAQERNEISLAQYTLVYSKQAGYLIQETDESGGLADLYYLSGETANFVGSFGAVEFLGFAGDRVAGYNSDGSVAYERDTDFFWNAVDAAILAIQSLDGTLAARRAYNGAYSGVLSSSDRAAGFRRLVTNEPEDVAGTWESHPEQDAILDAPRT